MSNKILLIDDDRVFTDVMQSSLERLSRKKYKVEVANSEEEAWKKIENNGEICLFLIDLELIPGSGKTQGFDLAQSLQENDKTKAIPIIFITRVFNDLKDERFDILGKGFFTKPIDSNHLLRKINTLCKYTEQTVL